jgi:hypothetical protein
MLGDEILIDPPACSPALSLPHRYFFLGQRFCPGEVKQVKRAKSVENTFVTKIPRNSVDYFAGSNSSIGLPSGSSS